MLRRQRRTSDTTTTAAGQAVGGATTGGLPHQPVYDQDLGDDGYHDTRTAHDRFLTKIGASTSPPSSDPRLVALEAIELIEKVQERLKDRLAHWPSLAHDRPGRLRIEAKLDALDDEITTHWAIAHPSSVGSVWAGGEPDDGKSECRGCPERIDRATKYEVGLCAACARHYESQHGTPPPRVPSLRSN